MKLERFGQLNESEQAVRKAEEAITAALAMSVQAHFWHWQTKSYAAHTALGEFYEKLTELADGMAEGLMGSGYHFVSDVDVHMGRFELDDAVQKIRAFKETIAEAENELMSGETPLLHGVGDQANDVIKAADKVLYLLTLK